MNIDVKETVTIVINGDERKSLIKHLNSAKQYHTNVITDRDDLDKDTIRAHQADENEILLFIKILINKG